MAEIKQFPDQGKDGKRYKLTAKQEAFVQAYLYGPEHIRGIQSAAYRAAYNAENMTPDQVWTEASLLTSNPKVANRMSELQEQDRQASGLTLEGLLAELEEARALALEWKQGGPAIQATMGRAKLGGFVVEKQQVDQTVRHADEVKPDQYGTALGKAKAS